MNEGHFTSYGFLREQGIFLFAFALLCISYVKSPCWCCPPGVWLLYNDAQVSVVDESEVASAQAYLLFYGRAFA